MSATNSTAHGPGPLGWIDDRLNPILVREVRQSLAGRYFRYTFWLTLVAATLVGVVVLANGADEVLDGRSADEVGVWFFTAIFTCLTAGVVLFVPFAAFNSLGSEWEENTYDLLVLSNLKPRQIILGKLLASQVQALMFYSAFGPFLIFAFVMRGVDLIAALFVFAAVGLFSVLMTLLALALSGVARARFARIAMMAGLTVGLVYASGGAAVTAFIVLESPHDLQNPQVWQMIGALTTGALLLCGLLFVVACGRLAHVEENRSTGLRIIAALIPLCGLPWAIWLYRVTSYRLEAPLTIGSIVLIALVFASASFATEPEELGRRVRKQVPRQALGAFLASPFLPGGGRGLLLFISLLVLLNSAYAATFFAAPPTSPSWSGTAVSGTEAAWRGLHASVVLSLYAFIYVALPSGLLSFARAIPRVAVAVAIPLFAILAFAVPTLWSLFVGGSSSGFVGVDHLGNPFWVIEDILNTGGSLRTQAQLAIVITALLTLALNVPRIARGMTAVLHFSAERRGAETPAVSETDPPSSADAVPES